MINMNYAHKFCKDDITKIENYEQALKDTTQTWDLHHRLELTLDGEFAHSRDELKRLGMYYHRPYFELIFLTKAEHASLHNKGKTLSTEHRQKLSATKKGKPGTMKGKHHSTETRRKMSESHKGKNLGKHLSDEHKQKLSAANKAYWASRRQEKLNEQN